MEEIGEMLIESGRIFQVDGVAGIRHDDQPGARNGALHQEPRLEARPVLVASHHQGRSGDGADLIDELVQRGPPLLHAAHRVRRALVGMLGKLPGELAPAARVFVLELHARRSERVGFCRLGHPRLESPRRCFGFLCELGPLLRRSPIAAACDHQRTRPLRIREAEMQRRKAAHGKADDMCLVETQRVEHGAYVIARAIL